jgi:anti-anti-sigma factor
VEYLQHLSIAVSVGPDCARIFLCGELDLNTADILRTRFNETFAGNGADRRSVIVLDLSDVTFCDAAGLRALRDIADKCFRLGTTLRLVNPSPKVRRVMELTDTLDQFNVEVDLRSSRGLDAERL